MRRLSLGMLFGLYALHQLPALPDSAQLAAGAVLAVLVLVGVLALPKAARPWQALALVRHGLILFCCATLAFCWGAYCARERLQALLPPSWEGQDILVQGVIAELPHNFERGVRFVLDVEQVLRPPSSVPVTAAPPLQGRKISLSWYAHADESGPPVTLRPGERWRLNLRLQRPHGNLNPYGFDYELWLFEQGMAATGYVRQAGKGTDLQTWQENRRLSRFVWGVGYWCESWRERIRSRMLTALGEARYGGVLLALVIGDQHALPNNDWQTMNRHGIGHLMSISGLHITMLAALAGALGGFLWRRSFFSRAALPLLLPAQKFGALCAFCAALVYVALAGWGVPAQRTLYMLAVLAWATWRGREYAPSLVLCTALNLVLLLDPWAMLWPGFWLSFVAVGLLLYAGTGRLPFNGGTNKSSGTELEQVEEHKAQAGVWTAILARCADWRSVLRQSARQLLAACHTQYVVTLGLLPLSLLLFAQVSLSSPLANALAIPLISFVVTPLALLALALPAPLDALAWQGGHSLVLYLMQGLDALQQGWASVGAHSVWFAPRPQVLQFGLAGTALLFLFAPRAWPGRWLALCLLLPMLMQLPAKPEKDEVWVTAFDVGQGTALLVETAQQRLLYDSGPAYSTSSDGGQRVLLPYLRARGIDYLDVLVISHSDLDHSGGARSLLANLQVGQVLSSLPPLHPLSQQLSQKPGQGAGQSAGQSTGHTACTAGQSWVWGQTKWRMLHPAASAYGEEQNKPNAYSCTLRMQLRGGPSLLLTGDIEAAQEAQLLRAEDAATLRSDILLVPHHGSGTSSSPAFLAAVKPQLAIFQLGYRNRYRHPQQQVWQRYLQLQQEGQAQRVQLLRSDWDGALRLRLHAGGVEVQRWREQERRYWHWQRAAGG